MEIKFVSRSSTENAITHNIVSKVATIEAEISYLDLDSIFTGFFLFLQNCKVPSDIIRTFVKQLSKSIQEDEDELPCTLEDCKGCDISDDCDIKRELENRAISSDDINTINKEVAYDDIKPTNNCISPKHIENKNRTESKVKELIQDTNYINKFKETLCTDDKILKTVLKTYLTAVFNNTVETI